MDQQRSGTAVLSPTPSLECGTPVTPGYAPGDYLQPVGGGWRWVVDTHGLVWCPELSVAPVDAVSITVAERRVGARLVPAGSWSEQAPLAPSPCHTPALHACPGCPPGGVPREMSAETSWRELAA